LLSNKTNISRRIVNYVAGQRTQIFKRFHYWQWS